MSTSEQIDYEELYDLLLRATRTAFTQVQVDHTDEQFYGFGLYHEPLWGYIVPTANTQEGLQLRAEYYREDRHNLGYARRSLSELASLLRWSPCDWKYHLEGQELFEPVNRWLQDRDFMYQHLDDDAALDTFDGHMVDICRRVLTTLDAEGVFGVGNARTRLVLNIMMGDQDGTWLEHAQALNPPDVYKRWLTEIDAI
jgi:uncharacterized protein DUF4303